MEVDHGQIYKIVKLRQAESNNVDHGQIDEIVKLRYAESNNAN